MSRGDSHERTVLSRNELARELRQQAYRKAKEQRAKDPRLIAMKEAMKIRRRAMYQEAKKRRKAAVVAQKGERKDEEQATRADERAAMHGELVKQITFASRGSNAEN